MKVGSFSVGDSAFVAVKVESSCFEIEVYEDAQAGTTNYYVAAPSSSDGPITKPAGAKMLFRNASGSPWTPGAVVGYVKTLSGTVNFAKEER